MKKRLLTIVTCIMLGSLCAFGLTACGHEHSYTDVVTPPTCTEAGYTTHTCECGEKYVDTEVAALGHSFVNYVSNNDATCFENGTETATCSREGCAVTDTREDDNSMVAHTFTNYVPKDAATCIKLATEIATCDVDGCSATDVRDVPNSYAQHTFTNYVSDNNATCIKLCTETAVCDVEGCNETDTRDIADSYAQHTFTNYVSDNNATYLADGTKTAICDVVGCNEDDTVADVGSRKNSKLTIKFNNGAADVVVEGYNGIAVDPVVDPTKVGYTFKGWTEEIPTTLPEGVTEITAEWTINQYTIIIKLGNGEDDIVLTQDYDSAINVPADPERANFKFDGWTEEIPTKMPALEEDLVIEAKWSIEIDYEAVEAEADGYVSDENDVLVLDEVEYNGGDFIAIVIDGVALGASDYSVIDNNIKFSQTKVTEYLGSYKDVYVLNEEGELGKIEVLFVNKVLLTAADVEEAFDYGDQKLGDKFEANKNSYVLGDNIDMTGVVMNNRMIVAGQTITTYVSDGAGGYTADKVTSVAEDVGFHGIFDGRGYAISNVTIEMPNWSLGKHVVDETGKESWGNAQAAGFFAYVRAGAQIKNVAFVNVYGTGSVNVNYGLNGLLGVAFDGILENVYFEASIDTVHARGPFANYGSNASLKNVVVSFPKADYTIESYLEAAKKPNAEAYYDIYAYGYGALSGHTSPINRNTKYENVFVVSPMPINLHKNANSGYAGINNVTYAENETALSVLFDYAEGTTVAEAIEAEKEEGAVKRTYQLAGIRRYDNNAALVADVDYVQALVDTGFFKIVNGQVIWHNQKPVVTVSDAVDFDAAEGELMTTVLEGKEVLSVKVAGEDVSYAEGKIVGITERNNLISESQVFSVIVETEEIVYNFTKVVYWTSVIEDQKELVAALDYDYSVDNLNNFGFYKLGNNINIDKATWTNIDYSDIAKNLKNDAGTIVSYWNGVSCNAGFAGIFDGAGYTIDFNQTIGSNYGLFGSLASGAQANIKQPATVKNVALINLGGTNWKPVIAQFGAQHTYNKGALIENIYVSWYNNNIMAGLIYEPNSKGTVINNVVVDIEDNRQYGSSINPAVFANKAVYGEGITDETLSAGGYYGATLFYSLRRGNSGIADTVTNFISLGRGGLGKTYTAGTNLRHFFKTTDNGDGTYTHALRNGGWTGTPLQTEAYFLYAGNKEYGDQAIPTGMKAGFAAIANTTSNVNAVKGYYCASCGQVFSLTEGTCSTCVVDDAPVALTESADLWKEAICFTWKATKLAEVNNANVGTTGEVVVPGASKYNTTAEMQAAYTANNDVFASFTGATGNGMWAVVEGKLVWANAIA